MDRKLLQTSLAQAERHVVEGERHVARQRNLVTALERDGHDTSRAVQLLCQFEELQAMHVADRDRLRKELGLSGRSGPTGT
jgi:hypothetical protein